MQDHLVVFTPSGKRGRFPSETTILAAARSLGVDLDSVCGGRGICGRCQVDVVRGDFAKHGIVSHATNVEPVNAVEARYAEKRGAFTEFRRLGCQAKIRGDLLVDVPADSQLHRQLVRKRAEAHPIAIDPVLHLHYLVVAEPDMHDPSSDFGRLRDALSRQSGIAKITANRAVLADLQRQLRTGNWAVTAAVRHDGRLVRLWPGFRDRAVGIAVDIGSTTIAAHLCDLVTGDVVASGGVMNPQIRFGEDLMSRVSFVMMNPSGAADLTATVRAAINDLVAELARTVGMEPGDILEMTVVCNPVMHHLLLGIDPTELGAAPFALAIDSAFESEAREIGIDLAPGAMVYILPCIAGHVGADAAGMVLSEAPYLGDDIRLLVDVGTNAEIILGNRSRLLAASSPTGPAFEGAQIACGQRAAPGAIERIRIDPATLEPRYKVIGCEFWSDEPSFDEAIAATGVTGLCGSGIIELVAGLFLAGIISPDGVFDGSLSSRSSRIEAVGRTFSYVIRDGDPRIVVYQTDIRAIQLAKSALYAGIKLLMQRYGIDTIDRITLAGAFGNFIDPRYAMVLGMIPDCDLTKVVSAGNAAGTGARIALLDRSSRAEIERVVRGIEKIETAIEPDFQDQFVAAMAVPHRCDPFPKLRSVVPLPQPTEISRWAGGRRRRPT